MTQLELSPGSEASPEDEHQRLQIQARHKPPSLVLRAPISSMGLALPSKDLEQQETEHISELQRFSCPLCILTVFYGGDDTETARRGPGHKDVQEESY